MKRTIISIAILASFGITGCSSTGSNTKAEGPTMPQEWKTTVKETELSVDFKDEGIKVYYTIFGKLEKIEVYGMAPAWKSNVTILAEADAMSKLVKFVHGKEVSSSETVKLLGKAIEKSQDGYTNDFDSKELQADNTPNSRKTNSALRSASVVNDTLVDTVTTITSRGRLTGIRKVKDMVQDNGKMYVAVYQWSHKDQATSEYLRKMMAR